MTLDEAIEHARERSLLECSACAEEHQQLAEWLTELRKWRNGMQKIIIAIVALIGLLVGLLACSTVSHAQAIGHDKYDHAAACYGIEYTLSECKPFNRWTPLERALFTTAVIGGGKEWYDHNHPRNHTAEWGDIAADACGAFGAEGTLWLVHKTW